jgi:hypothetical protein
MDGRPFDRLGNNLPCLRGVSPGLDPDPFAGLEILVMSKEMLELA